MLSRLQSETSFPARGAGWRFLPWEAFSASWPLSPTGRMDRSSPNSNPYGEFPTQWFGETVTPSLPWWPQTFICWPGLAQAAWPWPGVTPLLALSWPFYHQFNTEPESLILLFNRELHSQGVCPLICCGAFKKKKCCLYCWKYRGTFNIKITTINKESSRR